MKARLSRQPEAPKADWLAWSLHLIFGLVVGAGCGFYLALEWLPADFARAGQVVAFAAGVALVTGGAASHWGDALWMGRSLFGPAEHPRDATSAAVSMVIGAIGAALAVGALCMDSGFLPQGVSLRLGPHLILLLPAGVLLALCIHGIRSDTMIGLGWHVHRHDSPFFFWLLFAMQLAGGMFMVLQALT
jgi:hypothetical protein